MREKGRLVEVDGRKVYCLSAGTGPAVLLLHGLGASSYSWRHVWPSLMRTHSVHAIDFPGYGRSDKPLDFDYSPGGYARVVLGLMDRLGIAQAHLVGNSMGGVVSLFTALRRPERVASLTLVGTPTYPESRPGDLWALRWPVVGRMLEWSLGTWTIRWAARQTFIDRSVITPELVREYASTLKSPGGRRAVAGFIRNAIPPEAQDLIASYPRMPHRTLILWGERDCLVKKPSVERLARELPNNKLVVVPGCGHAPQEERPDVVNPVLHDFLAGPA